MTTSVPVTPPRLSSNSVRRVPPETTRSTRLDAPSGRQVERHAARTGAWCGGDEMSALETVLWRTDSDRATLCSPLLAIEQLDTVPDWERLIAAHQELVQFAPRLQQRVVEAPLGLGTPLWSLDPDFDLRFHVWRACLPSGAGWPELLEFAARLAMRPFDRARPPWEAVLYEGLPGGKSAYLLKMHHSLTDGLGAAQLLDQLHARDRLGGVPVGRELHRADLQMQLRAGAGAFRGDRVACGVQTFDTVDRDVQVLAAGGEDLVVEQRVPRVGRQRLP